MTREARAAEHPSFSLDLSAVDTGSTVAPVLLRE
jgi:hypothetical protein